MTDRISRRFSPGLTPILAEGNWSSKSLNLAERGVLQMLADGMSTKRIALEMHIAERTARDYVGKAIQKLRAKSHAAITLLHNHFLSHRQGNCMHP